MYQAGPVTCLACLANKQSTIEHFYALKESVKALSFQRVLYDRQHSNPRHFITDTEISPQFRERG